MRTKGFSIRAIITTALLLVVIAATATSASAANIITVTVDGRPAVWTDAFPYVNADNRTMVPLRAAADAMGIGVEWDAETSSAVFTAAYASAEECPDTYERDGIFAANVVVMFQPNQSAYSVIAEDIGLNETRQMDTAAIVTAGRTYAPIRYLAEALGYTVEWSGSANSVVITSDDYGVVPEFDYTSYALDAEVFATYFAEAFNAGATKFTVHYPNITSYDGVVDMVTEAYSLYTYDNVEMAEYHTPPAMHGQLNANGLTLTFQSAWEENGQARREESFELAAEFLSGLYQDKKLSKSMPERDRAYTILYNLKEQSSYLNVDPFSSTAWSVLSRHHGACQGYTAAYDMLLKMDGIDCYAQHGYVYDGSGHIWTVAKLDGAWYHIDATWNIKDYFALSAAEMAKDHRWEERYAQ